MRLFLSIVFFLPLFVVGQRKVSVALSTGDCRKNEHVRIGVTDTIRFYQNGRLYKQVIPMNYSKWPIEIKDFNSGSYRVTYTNLYGRKTEKTVHIPATKQYELALCPDELNEHPHNSLAQLQNGEAITITFSSQGCFHDVEEVLSLTKQKEAFLATLLYEGKSKSRTLDSIKLKASGRFENELIAIKDGGCCTTTDFYTFVDKTMTFRKVDGGCEWKGFYRLKKALFGKLD